MSFSVKERDRRYAAIRELMKKENLGCLLIASRDTYSTRGNTRYVTNHGNNFGEELVLFPSEGDPTIIASGIRWPAVQRGQWINAFIGFSTQSEKIERINNALFRLNKERKIGLIGMEFISVPVYLAIQNQFADSVIDANWIFEELRPVKSLAEIEKMRVSSSIADKVLSAIRDMLRPGLSDYEIYSKAKMIIHEMGCEYSMELINGHFPWGHIMEANEIMHFELTPAYEGYYTQLLVDLPVGEYRSDIQELIDVWKEAFAAGVNNLCPGRRVSDVFNAILTVIHQRGCIQKQARFGHSIGLDVIDYWEILPTNNTELKPGMTLVLHPSVILKAGGKPFGGGYTYLIKDTGAEKLNKVNFV